MDDAFSPPRLRDNKFSKCPTVGSGVQAEEEEEALLAGRPVAGMGSGCWAYKTMTTTSSFSTPSSPSQLKHTVEGKPPTEKEREDWRASVARARVCFLFLVAAVRLARLSLAGAPKGGGGGGGKRRRGGSLAHSPRWRWLRCTGGGQRKEEGAPLLEEKQYPEEDQILPAGKQTTRRGLRQNGRLFPLHSHLGKALLHS